MIRGFENITNELSFQEEREILPFVIGGLKTKIGKSNSITGSEIVRKMNSFFPENGIKYKLTGVRLRKMINYIRTRGLIECLCSTSKGYFVGSISELEDCIESQIQRINSQQLVVESLERDLRSLKR
jgi:hypothetical protein|tara:strand:- start:10245 stop:10625 length:381 start_codon:yes stop_codon:yes gene_type:complete